jgi:antitoxin component YwqK of YwqJK toxin-antitoxin module
MMRRNTILFILILISQRWVNAQIPDACLQSRSVCPMNSIQFCHEAVAYDEEHNLYLLRKDFSTPYNGTCVSCYPSLIIEEKINFVNGRRQGIDTSYYRSGCIQSIQSYQIGLQDGPTYIYHDSTNRLQFEIWYQSGLLNGPSIQYNPQTADTLTYKQYKGGKLNGTQKNYFNNGQLRKISEYRDGLLEGGQITYNEIGLKESEIYFRAGKKHGKWIYYFDSGKIAREETWKDGKKNGDFVSYNELGKVLSAEKFTADMPIGLHQSFYADGKLNYSCSYTNKGQKIEEYVIDQYGIKKQLFPPINDKE